MAISEIDRELKDLPSTKGKSFAHLIHQYSYRRDLIPLAKTKKHARSEILCRMNYRVCKKAGLDEIAISWKSLAKISC